MKPSLAVNFEFRACLAGMCLCSQNINKYLNKPLISWSHLRMDHIFSNKWCIFFIWTGLSGHPKPFIWNQKGIQSAIGLDVCISLTFGRLCFLSGIYSPSLSNFYKNFWSLFSQDLVFINILMFRYLLDHGFVKKMIYINDTL